MKPNELIEDDFSGNSKLPGVYGIYCSRNNKIYIGSTVKIDKRWREHKFYLKNGCHQNTYLQRAWNKYGADSFCFIILENCIKDQIRFREAHYLSLIDASLVFNLGQVGDSFELSDEIKEKISKANKGRIPAQHTQEAAWAANRGRKCSEETKKKMSQQHKNWNMKIGRGSKFTMEQIKEIKMLAHSGIPQKEIMDKFGISRGHLYQIKVGLKWKEIN